MQILPGRAEAARLGKLRYGDPSGLHSSTVQQAFQVRSLRLRSLLPGPRDKYLREQLSEEWCDETNGTCAPTGRGEIYREGTCLNLLRTKYDGRNMTGEMPVR